MARAAVVGAGPTGVAAAVQLARCGHVVTVFECGRLGGLVRNARLVDNYPGFPDGIPGPRLARLLERHLKAFVRDICAEHVESVEYRSAEVWLTTPSGEHVFDCAVICTGTVPERAGFEGEEVLFEAGLLLYEPSGLDHRKALEKVAVVGGGEASLDYALGLAEMGSEVTLIHRSDPTGNSRLLGEAKGHRKITFLAGGVDRASVDDDTAVLRVKHEPLAFDMVLVAVGRRPATPELLDFDIGSPPACVKFAGDTCRGKLGQVAIAVGDGLRAAMELDALMGAEP